MTFIFCQCLKTTILFLKKLKQNKKMHFSVMMFIKKTLGDSMRGLHANYIYYFNYLAFLFNVLGRNKFSY